METPQEIFARVLNELGFYNYKPSEMSNSDYHLCTITAMQEIAKQTAIAQREACYKRVKGVNYNPVSEHIFDSILNTKLVVD